MEEKKDVTSASDASVDYKAELDKANTELASKKKELDQAKFTLQKKNIEEKTGKSKIFDKNDEDDIADSKDDVTALVDKKVSEQLAARDAQDFLSKHSANQDEIELAKFHLENTIKPSGNPEADAIAALAIANRGTLLKQKEEMKTALANKAQQNQTSMINSSGTKVEVNEFGKYLTPQQLGELRGKHGMTDAQIQVFLNKKMGRG